MRKEHADDARREESGDREQKLPRRQMPEKIQRDTDIRFTFDGILIQALNIVRDQFTRPLPSHSHGNGCYEIHYIPCGRGRLRTEGTSYELSPGSLYVTGPHVEHAQYPAAADPMQEYCVYLKIRSAAERRKDSPVMDVFLSTPFWIGTDTQDIHTLMIRLFDELEHRYIGYMNQVELLLSQLLISMVRNYRQHSVSGTSFARNNLTNLNSIVIEEYFLYEYRSLSLSGLSDRLKLSPRQTQRLLTEYYGKSFQSKKTEARMSAAAILLADRNRSITSIAEELGYSSVEHFSSAFRKYYLTSPRDYRSHMDPGNT